VAQFRDTLEQALASQVEPRQYQMFDTDERAQLDRDVEDWRRTLAGLGEQEVAEQQQIERRYSQVRSLTFPAAIVFVVPEPAP
jgi:hypothetical protein